MYSYRFEQNGFGHHVVQIVRCCSLPYKPPAINCRFFDGFYSQVSGLLIRRGHLQIVIREILRYSFSDESHPLLFDCHINQICTCKIFKAQPSF